MSNILQNKSLNWVEIKASALISNIKTLKKCVGAGVTICPSVKANAYGHGLIETSKIITKAGTRWLGVNSIYEARKLRDSGIKCHIYIMGYVLKKDLEEAVELNCLIVVYNKEAVRAAALAARKLKRKAKIHIKIETGNYRQGVHMEDVLEFAAYACSFPEIIIEGVATHFANIEDADPSKNTYAARQLQRFRDTVKMLDANGFKIPYAHCANSGAVILFPETHFNFVRPGIAIYGLWPDPKIKQAAHKIRPAIELAPVLSWRTRIAQIKNVPRNGLIGYGCTFRAPKQMKIAVLPIGYYEGFDRGFSNKGHVLIHGRRAKICGRVCMNMAMVDVTEIPRARVEDTATILGRDGNLEITAEELGEMIGTINYEITTRINENIPRVIV